MNRPHGHFHGEGGKEGKPQPGLHFRRESGAAREKGHDIRGAGLPVHGNDGDQHQHGAQQGIEEELEAGVDAARAAPHADDEEHGDQARFEEDIEQHQIKGGKHADHQGFEHEKGDHVFAYAFFHMPACQNADRHEKRSEQDEQHRDAIHTHLIGGNAAQPFMALNELEARVVWIEVQPNEK